MVQVLGVNRKLSPRRLQVEVGGALYNVGGYHRALPLMAGGARVSYSPASRMLSLSTSPRGSWQINTACCDGEGYINFWHHVLGIKGDQQKREDTEDAAEFFRSFLRAAEKQSPFTHNLLAETDEQGAIIFEDGTERIPLMAHRFHYDNLPNTKVKLVPFFFNDEIAIAVINPADGSILTEVDYDQEVKRFFLRPRDRKNRPDEREYLISLLPSDLFLVAQLPGYQFHFTRSDRRPGEVVKVRLRNDKLLQISAFRCIRPLTFRRIETTGGTEVLAVGPMPNVRLEDGKLRPQVRVHTDSQRKGVAIYHTSPAGVIKIYLPLDVARKYALVAGKMVEIEPLQGKVAALIVEKDGRAVRLPLILVWRWEADKFELAKTVSENIYPKYLAGCCVIEQKETLRSGPAEYLSAGNRRYPLFPSVPWKTDPLPLAAFLDDSGQLIFFRDAARFSARDWKIIHKYMEAECGKIDETQRKVKEAEDLAAQADALLAEASTDIFNLKGLEQAYERYLDAFLLDPRKAEYLKMARHVRGLCIVRRRQLEKRGEYRSFLKQKEKLFGNGALRDETVAQVLADYLASAPLNCAALAYFLEVLAGMAEGRYTENPEPYRRAFRCLPLVLDSRRELIWKFMGALRILMEMPELNYVPRFILNSPPAADARKRELFAARRVDAGCPKEDPRRSWNELDKKRAVCPIPKIISSPLTALVREVGKTRRAVLGFLAEESGERERADALTQEIRARMREVVENTGTDSPLRRRLLIILQGLLFTMKRKSAPNVVE